MADRIPIASKSLREHRQANKNKARYKFWYETKSGNQLMTEFMDRQDAELWLKINQQHIVGIQVIERMSREEALKYLKMEED